MIEFIRKILELKYEFRERKHKCENCETLKLQVEQLRYDNKALLDRLLFVPEKVEEKHEVLKPLMPKHKPWAVQRQELEANDRARARVLKEKEDELERIKQDKDTTVEQLEAELDIVAKERESQIGERHAS